MIRPGSLASLILTFGAVFVNDHQSRRPMAGSLRWSDLDVTAQIGEGQSAIVWLAALRRSYAGLSSGTPVAVKLYKRWVLEEPGQLERIYRQRELGALVQHPHLVKTLSLVVDGEGRPGIVMAYVPGETLAARLEQLRLEGGAFAPVEALRLIGEVAGALAALHSAGFIHRDVKPANILLGSSGAVLADIGVVSSGNLVDATTTGAFLGTIRYAAPEYLFGLAFDSTIDHYSLGAVAYELFFGEQFCSGLDHWAALVVQRYNHLRQENHPRLARPETYQQLAARFTVNGTEAIRFILQSTLAPRHRRTIDLHSLTEAAQHSFWEGPFHTENGRIISTEPRLPSLGVWNSSTGTHTPAEIASELRRLVPPIVLERLLDCLGRDYWQGFTDEFLLCSEFHALRKAGGALDEGGVSDCGSINRWRWHDSVRAAFRYGYLPECENETWSARIPPLGTRFHDAAAVHVWLQGQTAELVAVTVGKLKRKGNALSASLDLHLRDHEIMYRADWPEEDQVLAKVVEQIEEQVDVIQRGIETAGANGVQLEFNWQDVLDLLEPQSEPLRVILP
jgi:serine/threonine protein kinase